MTLPRVFHDVFIAVVDTVAESIEGEVGPVRWIFSMFETNLRQVFLTFDRFSSLRKRCRVTRHSGQSACRTVPQLREQGPQPPPRSLRRASGQQLRFALLPPSFGNPPFTMRCDSARRKVRICPEGRSTPRRLVASAAFCWTPGPHGNIRA